VGDTRSVGEGVRELRIDYSPGYRVYYAIEDKRILLLLLGGDKSRQRRDITTAKEYWQDHKERNNYD
jgi:putative addiction module killer protein